jgi:hypothetical protein
LGSNLAFAREALAIFRSEAPDHYVRIARTLRPAPGVYTVDAESISVTSQSDEVTIAPAGSAAPYTIRASISAPDVVRLIDGTVMLETLLADERLRIIASADDLLLLAEAVAAFLDGAIASRRLSDLFERYRAWV